jgi:hypothetical protein
MQVETLNPYYDPKKSSVANLKAWRIALEDKAGAVHRGKKGAKRVQCTEANGSLMTVGQQFDSGSKAAAVLEVGAQRVNDAANTQKKRVKAKDGKFYGFKYV